jgi:hypothetical protein
MAVAPAIEPVAATAIWCRAALPWNGSVSDENGKLMCRSHDRFFS